VKAAWVAGSTRARLLLDRRVPPDQVRAIAAADGLGQARERLDGTAYAAAAGASTLEAAQRAVAEIALFDLRLLLGWLPRPGWQLVRSLAAWFELVNIEDRLAYLRGAPLLPAFDLGALASAWPQAAGAASPAELRETLRASAWGDPGGADAQTVHLGLRVAWARRVNEHAPEARAWVAGALALLAARSLLEAGSSVRTATSPVFRELGDRWRDAETPEQLARVLPPRAVWALAGAAEPAELWRLEPAWWQRVARDAEMLVRERGGRPVVVGAVALLALDAFRVAAALAAAAAGDDAAREVVDALF
jgi:hypothetical protein